MSSRRNLTGKVTKNNAQKTKKRFVDNLVKLGVTRKKANEMITIEQTTSARTKAGNLAPRFKVIGNVKIK
jgi:hypothetical protein